MKDLGHLSYFLGLEITHSIYCLYITQAKYASELLSWARLTDSKTIETLVKLNAYLTPSRGKQLSNPSLCKRLVSSLVYLIVTRPDISYAVHQVSQFSSSPRSTQYTVVLRILRYLKGTLFHDLFYSAQSPLNLCAFSNADWPGDSTNRRSTTGYCFLLGSSLISWRNKKQTLVARSSIEAEYHALDDTTSKLLWLWWLLKDLECPHPLLLLFIMTIRVPFILLTIMSSMNKLNTSRSIVILSIVILFMVLSSCSRPPLKINF